MGVADTNYFHKNPHMSWSERLEKIATNFPNRRRLFELRRSTQIRQCKNNVNLSHVQHLVDKYISYWTTIGTEYIPRIKFCPKGQRSVFLICCRMHKWKNDIQSLCRRYCTVLQLHCSWGILSVSYIFVQKVITIVLTDDQSTDNALRRVNGRSWRQTPFLSATYISPV